MKIRAPSTKEVKEARRKLKEEIVGILNQDKINGVSRPQLQEQENQPERAYVTVGAFQHGGVVGVTNATKDNQLLTKKICELVGLAFPEELFSSVTIVRDTHMPITGTPSMTTRPITW